MVSALAQESFDRTPNRLVGVELEVSSEGDRP